MNAAANVWEPRTCRVLSAARYTQCTQAASIHDALASPTIEHENVNIIDTRDVIQNDLSPQGKGGGRQKETDSM